MAARVTLATVKTYYLRGVLAVYVIAFSSLYIQVQSLFGDNGIVPIRDIASKLTASKGSLEAYNIILQAPKLGLSYATFVELLCLISILSALAAIFMRRLMNALTFASIWFVYYSICQLGQGFMSFHSDLLLLEVGFISVLAAPLLPTARRLEADHDKLTFFVLRWLVFRFYVTNVLNVYLDDDKSWYDMSAIPMVAQGVQFPTQFSWRIFNLSTEHIRLFQAYEHVVKLVTPFLLMFDLKYSRLLAFYSLLFINVLSAFFTNFGWTDILMSVCLISFLRDYYFNSDKSYKRSKLNYVMDLLSVIAYASVCVALLVNYYGLKYEKGSVKTQVKFTPAQFKLFADHLIPISLVYGTLGFLLSTYDAIFTHKRKTPIIKTLLYTVVLVALFFSTFPTLTRFSPATEIKVKPLSLTKELSRVVAPYSLSNNYILYSKVSKHYSDGRPELHLQVRESSDSPTWEQVDFKYKVGHQSRELVRLLPHLPRVDLKLWYAARSPLQNNQWLQTLAYRIATKDRSINNLLAKPINIPKVNQIRVATYNYKYSSGSKSPFAGYWSQAKYVSDYLPLTTSENLKLAVKSNGVNLSPPSKPSDSGKAGSFDTILTTYLDISGDYIRGFHDLTIIWTLSVIAMVNLFSSG